ncbi:hypothetical protein [Bacillus velezensis]|nr:hypothetical protein [Bacillus velezensis]
MYHNLFEAGWSFKEIDEADYYGLVDVVSAGSKEKVMSGEEFFNSI